MGEDPSVDDRSGSSPGERPSSEPQRRSLKRSLVIVYTGDGKGKTTAALGIMMRARGRGLRVLMLSFIKGVGGDYGEQESAKKLGAEFAAVGRGFTWLSDDIKKDRAMAEFGWRRAQREIASGLWDVVILDELTYPLTYDWLSLDDLITALRDRPPGTNVVITGRKAPQGLIEFADLVSEMREVKHPFRQDIPALPGIDF